MVAGVLMTGEGEGECHKLSLIFSSSSLCLSYVCDRFFGAFATLCIIRVTRCV